MRGVIADKGVNEVGAILGATKATTDESKRHTVKNITVFPVCDDTIHPSRN